MTRTIVIELAGEEDILVAKSKKEAAPAAKREELMAPSPALAEQNFDELHESMPAAYRALFEEYFRR